MTAFYRCPDCNRITLPQDWSAEAGTCRPCVARSLLEPSADATAEHYRSWLLAHPKTPPERRDACAWVAAAVAMQDLTEDEYAILAVALAPLIGVVVRSPESYPMLASCLPR